MYVFVIAVCWVQHPIRQVIEAKGYNIIVTSHPGPFPKNIYHKGIFRNIGEIIWPKSLSAKFGSTTDSADSRPPQEDKVATNVSGL
jgi:hypothetical protein